jgi:hypothetical protein
MLRPYISHILFNVALGLVDKKQKLAHFGTDDGFTSYLSVLLLKLSFPGLRDKRKELCAHQVWCTVDTSGTNC